MKRIAGLVIMASFLLVGCSDTKKKFLPFSSSNGETSGSTSVAGKGGTSATKVSQATPTCSANPCNVGSTVTITVDFTEAVLVNGVPTLTLNNGKTATYVSGSGTKSLVFTYTVASGDDVLALNYQDTSSLVLPTNTTIKLVSSGSDADTTLPALTSSGSMASTSTLVIDTAVPTINSVSASTTNGTYTKNGKVYVTVTMSEAVNVTGNPTITLGTGNTTDGIATYVSGTGSNTLVFEYTVRSGDKVNDLNYTSTGALTLNGGTIKDAANNDSTLTLPATGSPTSLAGSKDINLDTTPTVASITTTTANGTYAAGSVINFTVTFTDAVTTAGTNTLSLANGKTATCTNVTNSTTMSCSYTVGSGDTSADLTYTSATALGGGGTVVSAANAGLAAVKTLPDPATFATDHDIVIVNTPSISFTAGTTATVAENVGGGNYALHFTLSAAAAADVTFTLTSANGTATAGNDFTGINQTVTITAGLTSVAVNIPITDDANYEGSEAFTLTMSSPSGNAVLSGNNTQTVTITDNETAPTVSLSATTYSGAEGSAITISVTRTGSSDLATTVTLATAITGAGATHAISGTDYTAFSGTINIPASAGNSTVTQNIQTTQDTVFENSETFTVALSSPVNATLSGTTSATVTITNEDTAPTASFTSGTTNTVGEGAGNYTLSVSLSEASGVDTVITVNTTNGTATAGSDYSALTGSTITIPAGQTVGTITIPITDDSVYEGANETFTATISGPTITGGAAQTITIIENDLGVTSVSTLDSDGNGKIDSFKVVFSGPVTDSSFPGYSANANGTTQSAWLIAGYTGLVLSNGTAAASAATAAGDGSDTLNDNTIYLRFTEGATTDTGAKPDLTTTTTPGLTGTGTTLPQIVTGTVAEQDSAKAVIISAIGTEGSNSLEVTFSEAVYTTTGVPACNTAADITVADTTFSNGNGSGAVSLTALTEACGTDKVITYTTNANLVVGDTADTISYSAGTVFDASNNQISTVAKGLTINTNAVPALTLLEELDTDHDGKIDTLQLTFDKNMSDATISGNLAQCTVGGLAVTAFDTGTTANDAVVRLSVSTSVATGTDFKTAIYTAGSWQSALGGNLASFNYTAHNGSGVPRDVAAPVIISAVAADPAPNVAGVDSGDTLTVTFSEAISNNASITNANITSLLSLSGGQTWPSIGTAVWSNGNKTVTITFNGTGTIADETLITAVNTTNKFVDAPNNFYASSSTMIGSFTTDVIKPYILFATDISLATTYSTAVTVNTVNTTKASGASFLLSFSEAVKTDGGVNAANLVANYTIAGILNGSAVTTPTIASVASYGGSSSVFLVTLTGDVFTGAEYTITGDNGLTPFTAGSPIQDLASNNLTTPNTATLIANDEFRVLTVKATTTTSVNITMSKLVDSATATCTDAATCAVKYYITPNLGTITGATVSNNIITLTISNSTMQGSVYTVVLANGVSTDDPTAAPAGFDTGAGDAVKSGGVAVSGNPKDRMSFMGAGTSIVRFESGWYMDDPFADGSVFSYTFNFKNKVFVGPNALNNTTLRFNPNGSGIIGNYFSFTNNNAAALSCGFQPTNKTWGFGFETAYSSNTACDGTDGAGGPKYVGPLKEIGLVGFSSAKSTSGPEFLLVGPLKSNAGEGYFTEDTDNTLNMRSFSVPSFTGGANTQSIQTFYSYGTGLFIGYSTDLGTQSPILLRSEIGGTTTVTSLPGGNATGAVNMGTTAAAVLQRSETYISSGDPVGIDAVLVHRDFLYVSSSTGLAATFDITTGFTSGGGKDRFAGKALVTPTFATGSTLVMPGTKVAATVLEGLGKVSPGQKGIPFLKTHNNGLYMVRNAAQGTTHTASAMINELNKMPSYGEVYFCATPTGVAEHLDGGTKRYCQTSDWSKLFSTEDATFHGKTAACSAQGTSTNCGNVTGCSWIAANSTCTAKEAISMFEINDQGVVYIGVDSPQGFRIYRNPTGTTSNIPASSGWAMQGTSGLGSGYTHIQSSTIIKDPDTASTNFMYITTGKHHIDTTTPANSLLWHVPFKVFRQGDVGISIIVGSLFDFNNKFEKGNLLAFIAKTRKSVPIMVLFGIALSAAVGLGLRKKYLKDHHLI